MMNQWTGKVALVTGASSGIGTAVARSLRRGGMKVAVCARRLDALEALATDDGWLPVQVDLRDEDDILAMFDTIRRRWGGVDVLVNNAGLGHVAPLSDPDTPTAYWREMLEVNVLALSICTREALRDMQRNDHGYVVHISSMAAHRVPANSGIYSATKYAVRALTEGLRQELHAKESGIRVGSVSPGFVETGFHEVFFKSAERAAETYGRYRVLDPVDVARAVVWLLEQPPHVQVHDVLMRPTAQPV